MFTPLAAHDNNQPSNFELANMAAQAAEATQAQLIPEKELTFQDDDANNLYLEHLRNKEKIRERIEALSRESTFLNQLNPDQYAYMYQKQHESKL